MIKSDTNKGVVISGNIIDIMEDFANIVSDVHYMLSEDLGEDASREVIADMCFVATHSDLDDEVVKSIAQNTISVFERMLESRRE